MNDTLIPSILALLMLQGSLPSLAVGDEQRNKPDELILEIITCEVMVDQLEKMPRATKDASNAWVDLWLDIGDRFSKIITYETRDNLNLWKLSLDHLDTTIRRCIVNDKDLKANSLRVSPDGIKTIPQHVPALYVYNRN